MSYCRFTEADVYVYMDVGGYLRCCGCSLGLDVPYRSTDRMIMHLTNHIAARHHVPAHVIPALRDDDAENFPREAS